VKARIPTAAISRTLQAVGTFGLAAPLSAMGAATQGNMITAPSQLTESTETVASIFSDLTGDQEVSSAVNFPIAGEWDHKAGRRFFELVDREAKNVATAQEIEELENLSNLRRRFEAPRSGEEVLREYEQHQLIRDLLQSLTRYVEFVRSAPTEPSSTRSRAKAKA
jgi:hypothetical protein